MKRRGERGRAQHGSALLGADKSEVEAVVFLESVFVAQPIDHFEGTVVATHENMLAVI